VLLHYDFVTHRKAQTCSGSCRFRRKKRFKNLLPDLLRNAVPIIPYADFDVLLAQQRRDPQSRTKLRACLFRLLIGRESSVVHDVQNHAAQVMRHHLHHRHGRVIFFFNSYVEVDILRAESVVGELDVLGNQAIQVGVLHFPTLPPRMHQHALHDAVGAFAMFPDLGGVCIDIVERGFDELEFTRIDTVFLRSQRIPQIIDE